MYERDRRRQSIGHTVALILASPLIFGLLLLVLLLLPFVALHGFLFRCLVEILWGHRGKRILFVYSESPHWKEYIESQWLPRLREHAVILNWSQRSSWARESPFASRVFKHWAPRQNFNPMAVLFPPFRPARRVGFYYAFRDVRHGKEDSLRQAEDALFEFINTLEVSA